MVEEAAASIRNGNALDQVADTDALQCPDRVDPEPETGADLARRRLLLEDGNREALPSNGDCSTESADAGAGDDDVWHDSVTSQIP